MCTLARAFCFIYPDEPNYNHPDRWNKTRVREYTFLPGSTYCQLFPHGLRLPAWLSLLRIHRPQYYPSWPRSKEWVLKSSYLKCSENKEEVFPGSQFFLFVKRSRSFFYVFPVQLDILRHKKGMLCRHVPFLSFSAFLTLHHGAATYLSGIFNELAEIPQVVFKFYNLILFRLLSWSLFLQVMFSLF